MKPKPLASLNHLTLPVMRDIRYSLLLNNWIGFALSEPLKPKPERLLESRGHYINRPGSRQHPTTATGHRGGPMTERIDTLLKESRKFPPPKAFREGAHVRSPQVYRQAARNRARFWADRAGELEWIKPWRKVV